MRVCAYFGDFVRSTDLLADAVTHLTPLLASAKIEESMGTSSDTDVIETGPTTADSDVPKLDLNSSTANLSNHNFSAAAGRLTNSLLSNLPLFSISSD